jgi:PDZ domain-containing secreted protein/Zn-dependent protease
VYRSGFTVLRVRGIPIGVNWSWAAIAVLLTWSLAGQVFPHSYPGLPTATYVAMGVAGTLLFFASIVLHELGHAFRALKEGMQIEGITLWLFGGVARFLGAFPSPGAEFRIAIAGPLVSAGLVVAFGALAGAGGRLGIPVAADGTLRYLAGINLLLAVFNLVPALPLDGGRILQALLWKWRGDFASATRASARLGQGFGVLLGGLGILAVLGGSPTSGIWLAALGVFIVQAARSEGSYGTVDTAFRASRVRDVMDRPPAFVAPETTIADFLAGAGGASSPSAYPVANGGRLLGLISRERAGSVPSEDQRSRTVADVMTAAERVAVLPADMPVLQALPALRSTGEPALVIDGTQISGVVSMANLAGALHAHLAGRARPARVRRTGVSAGLVVVVAALAAAGVLYHPPLYVLSPGPASDVSRDISIQGVPARVPTGRYLLTTVRAEKHPVLQDLVELFRPHRQLIAASEIGSLRFQDEMFDESRVLAAAAAARANQISVTVTGTGAEVTALVGGTSAAKALRTGDVIVAVDGAPVRTEFDVEAVVGPKPVGTPFQITIERAGARLTVPVSSAPAGEGGRQVPVIGAVLVTRGIALQAPFTVAFRPRDIGGPSAGLAYALAISDALGHTDLANGRTVAATGTITLDGTVGDVGGVDLKAIGARREGAQLFFVPAAEANAARGLVAAVKGVASLSDALSVLRGES